MTAQTTAALATAQARFRAAIELNTLAFENGTEAGRALAQEMLLSTQEAMHALSISTPDVTTYVGSFASGKNVVKTYHVVRHNEILLSGNVSTATLCGQTFSEREIRRTVTDRPSNACKACTRKLA
jgi:hypothetical protein